MLISHIKEGLLPTPMRQILISHIKEGLLPTHMRQMFISHTKEGLLTTLMRQILIRRTKEGHLTTLMIKMLIRPLAWEMMMTPTWMLTPSRSLMRRTDERLEISLMMQGIVSFNVAQYRSEEHTSELQ